MAKKKVRRKSEPTEGIDFEQSLAELETIVAELERGDLGLSQALERYERGIGRLKQCHAELGRVSRRIEILSGVDAAGNPISQPYDEEEFASLDEKQQARSRRRATKAPSASRTPSVDDDLPLF